VARASTSFPFPILFMGYYNSVFQMGAHRFCARLSDAGARGFIVADLPPEEATELNALARAQGLDPILLMTRTSSTERLAEIGRQASGFVYCAARTGVTGKQTDLSKGVETFLARCGKATPLPLALGFGIKTPADVRAVQGLADIAVVGTACLEAWEQRGPTGYRELLRGLVSETSSGTAALRGSEVGDPSSRVGMRPASGG
jgi:tryptophan synthase alpha chain